MLNSSSAVGSASALQQRLAEQPEVQLRWHKYTLESFHCLVWLQNTVKPKCGLLRHVGMFKIPKDFQNPIEKPCCYCNISGCDKSTSGIFTYDEFTPLSCKYCIHLKFDLSEIFYSQIKLASLLVSCPILSVKSQKKLKM